ncbi:DUF5990 family protein [Streptomyces sp. NBC_00299]|uniref:DUF5990 family protein n=1 Tax=Streptomyces sp. NBC_00299 TaxID=2975705 RepID=UPI002E2DB32B|nr:DUF5990 family protein [Streptomyces sp. NBC_00299]
MTGLHIRIDAVDLPGLTCPPEALSGAEVPEYRYIHIAVQRRDRPTELLAPQPRDAVFATWTLDCAMPATPSGRDVRGGAPHSGPSRCHGR